MATTTNIYPPIIDVAMPAFVTPPFTESKEGPAETNVTIKFSVSKYNAPSDLSSYCCVSLTDAATNYSCFNTISGLKFYPWDSVNGAVVISSADLAKAVSTHNNGWWDPAKRYKLQIRFIKAASVVQSPTEANKFGIKTENNTFYSFTDLEAQPGILTSIQQNHFSEWSTVCLLKPILQPTINLGIFTPENPPDELVLSIDENQIVGSFYSQNGERLESYQAEFWRVDDHDKYITLSTDDKKTSNLKPVFDTDIIYNTLQDSNGINFKILYTFEDGVRYRLLFTYITENRYTSTEQIDFVALNTGGERLDAELTLTPDPEFGRIIINVSSESERYLGNLTIRRTSSRSNFTYWEDVHHIPITSARDGINETWYDYAIESGVWYKYGVQKRGQNHDRGLIVPGKEPVMAMLNDIFISTKEKSLRIKFNPQINQITHVRTEASTQPLGSKYPFIKRNGATEYRQFTISGLISHFMDEENLFSSKEDVYGNMLERHENYNYENRINDYTDFILEREFRKKVEEFLCDGKIKLFKSTPEGSMLVRLMNVSLTPEKALGRMLYSFSATAYEIADLTIKNINDYEIQDIGTLLDIPSGVYEKYLQLKIDNFGEYVTDKTGTVKNQDIFEAIAQHEKDNQDNPIYLVKATKIKKLKISFEGEPYRIYYKSSTTETNPTDGFFANPEEVKLNREKFFKATSQGLDAGEHWTDYQQVLGYLFAFVGNKDTIIQKFFVPYRYTENERGEFLGYGEYTIQGDSPLLNTDTVKIVGLVPREKEGGIPVLLDCLAEIEEYHQTVINPNAVSLYNKFGQVHSVFAPLDNPVSLIKEKGYYLERDSQNRIVDQSYVYFINSIRVESEPFAVFYKRSNDINEYIRYVLGPGGYLTLEEEDFSIQELYFKGIYLPKISREKQSYNEVNEINNPKKDCVYRVKSLKNVYKPYNLNRVSLNSYTSTIEDLFDDKLSYYSVVFIDNTWWIFDETDSVAIMPLYALVDYNYDLEVRHYEYAN